MIAALAIAIDINPEDVPDGVDFDAWVTGLATDQLTDTVLDVLQVEHYPDIEVLFCEVGPCVPNQRLRAALDSRLTKSQTHFTRTCPECRRVFDLTDETDADEFYNGHDCEDNG